MLSAKDRVVMISGANRGIGAAVAKTLGDQGYQLSLGARKPETISTGGLSGSAMTHAWDATRPDDSTAWVAATLQQFGRIDAMVLNAGMMLPAGLSDGAPDDMDAMWAVNFKGPLHLVQAALPALRDSGHGRVANIVSLAGKRLLAPGNLGYGASKFAALALTHAIRQEGWSDGIRATAICPGLVDTDMVAGVQPASDQFKIAPETIAATVAYALALPNEASVAELLVNSRLELAM